MQFISKMAAGKVPSVVIMTDMMELLNYGHTVVMYRGLHKSPDAAVFFVFEQGNDDSLYPIVRQSDGAFRRLEHSDTMDRRESGIQYTYFDGGEQSEDDAIVLVNQLYSCGVIDGYMGFVNDTVELSSVYDCETIERTQLLESQDPEPFFDLDSKYGLYFKDELTDAYYPVESAKIWPLAVLDSAWYFTDNNEECRLSNVLVDHPELSHGIGIRARKAIRHINMNIN